MFQGQTQPEGPSTLGYARVESPACGMASPFSFSRSNGPVEMTGGPLRCSK